MDTDRSQISFKYSCIVHLERISHTFALTTVIDESRCSHRGIIVETIKKKKNTRFHDQICSRIEKIAEASTKFAKINT